MLRCLCVVWDFWQDRMGRTHPSHLLTQGKASTTEQARILLKSYLVNQWFVCGGFTSRREGEGLLSRSKYGSDAAVSPKKPNPAQMMPPWCSFITCRQLWGSEPLFSGLQILRVSSPSPQSFSVLVQPGRDLCDLLSSTFWGMKLFLSWLSGTFPFLCESSHQRKALDSILWQSTHKCASDH